MVKLTNVKIKWCDDYYDGPIKGVCTYGDRWCYFFVSAENVRMYLDENPDWIRKYSVVLLTKKERRREKFRHFMFNFFVVKNKLKLKHHVGLKLYRFICPELPHDRYEHKEVIGEFLR